MRRKKTAAFYDSQKRLATEHAVFDDVGHGEPVREAGKRAGHADVELHAAAAWRQLSRQRTIQPSARCLRRRRSWSRRSTR